MGFWSKLFGGLGGSTSASGAPSAGSPSSEPARPSPEEVFTATVIAEALERSDVERVERVPGAFALRVFPPGTEQPWTLYLGNLFHETREDAPEQRIAKIHRLFAAVGDNDEDLSWEEAAPRLVPLVRLVSFASGVGVTPLARPFAPFLRLLVGLDCEHSVAVVNRERIEGWGQSVDAVFAAAVETLAAHVLESDVEPYDPEAAYPIFHVTRDDSYEASRLALPGFLASFRGKVPGNPIAIVPTRSTLVISGDGDPEAIARLARTAEAEFLASPRAVSPAVYTVDDSDRVVPLHLPSDHPKHLLVERGHRILAASCYAAQKAELEKRYEAENVDVFVASLTVFENEQTKKLTTVASWAAGVPTLLPEADLVVLGTHHQPDGWMASVPWATVMELAGHCLEKDSELDPPRYRTVEWPSETVVAELRARAVG
jgi:uncharacterized protein YtpQ (UPF0354 family)